MLKLVLLSGCVNAHFYFWSDSWCSRKDVTAAHVGNSSPQCVLCTPAVQGLFPVGLVAGPTSSISGRYADWPSTGIKTVWKVTIQMKCQEGLPSLVQVLNYLFVHKAKICAGVLVWNLQTTWESSGSG